RRLGECIASLRLAAGGRGSSPAPPSPQIFARLLGRTAPASRGGFLGPHLFWLPLLLTFPHKELAGWLSPGPPKFSAAGCSPPNGSSRPPLLCSEVTSNPQSRK